MLLRGWEVQNLMSNGTYDEHLAEEIVRDALKHLPKPPRRECRDVAGSQAPSLWDLLVPASRGVEPTQVWRVDQRDLLVFADEMRVLAHANGGAK
jgi:hypothetical protein